ncbi:MAG: sodium:proton antiporter [Candidatus Eisenbacteria bacterium]|uniref:Sodium:proton antiporter n=1 Tax=Eiseniibacteriota bacterium TaxID=2212470 RepID=A0A956NGB7_UNCEI|nr:sodium:proton antiporter [Candidatus Eisenbacteria bacterium]
MTHVFDTAAVLLMLAAAFGLFNHHVLRLPFTIGLMLSALAASAAVLVLDGLVPGAGLVGPVRTAVMSIDFHDALMHGMLSFLLFAGALHVEMEDLVEHKVSVIALASLGLLISTAIIGFASFGVFQLLGVSIALPYCLVFGALISPTDPIAVLGIMKAVGAPRNLEIKVAGESLFNDGFAVVVFGALLAWATATGVGHEAVSHGAAAVGHGAAAVGQGAAAVGHGAAGAGAAAGHGAGLGIGSLVRFFVAEVGGGIALGLGTGYVIYLAMRHLDEPNLEILLSMALVMGLTFLAFRLHVSAPLACVVAGLFIGNRGRRLAMSARTRNALDIVWAFIDEMLNAILFLLVGLEIFAVELSRPFILAGFALIPIGLIARWISVWFPTSVLRLDKEPAPGALKVLTWGGLKGGISVALALSLPDFEGRGAILTVTYAIVVFSIVFQGLTIGRVVRGVSVPAAHS